MNAHQIASRLIGFGLAPVELLPPNHPSEADRPPDKRGKAPFVRDWQKQPAPRSVADMPDLLPECNVGVRTGRVPGARFVEILEHPFETFGPANVAAHGSILLRAPGNRARI
jgi:hypothetical protein